jgi:micrococcal nuclease
VPDIESDAGQAVLALLDNRYLTTDEQHIRRNYAYVRGALHLYRDDPELTVSSVDQIRDEP